MAGGTYLVARRIRIRAEAWDRTALRAQEEVVGRAKASGAPLSGGTEFTDPDFDARGPDGELLIAPTSHMALGHPNTNGGVVMLRRGYNFTDGADAAGRLDTGLFFLAFVRDPRTQFTPMQDQMSRFDAMTTDFLVTTGSGVFAIPAGVASTAPDAFIGEALFS
jgi:deferrochelatase/peroxidase EfeB